MRRYRIIAQIYLILSILNLVLAAPVVVQRIHEARGDDDLDTGTAEDVAVVPNESGKLPVDAASDTPTSPPSGSSSNAQDVASPQHSPSLGGSTSSGYPTPSSPNALAVASPQHSPSLDGAASSGYPTPHLSPASSVSGYSWLLERPPRLSPNRPGSPYASASSGSLSSQYFSASEGPQSSPTENSRVFSGEKTQILADLTIIGLVIGGIVGLSRLGRHNDTGS